MGREVKDVTDRNDLGDLYGDYALPCRVLLANGRMRVNRGQSVPGINIPGMNLVTTIMAHAGHLDPSPAFFYWRR